MRRFHHKISKAADSGYGAVSVVMENNNGKRSFKISYKKPDGKSYAHEIAYKYGITFEQLSKNSDKIWKKRHGQLSYLNIRLTLNYPISRKKQFREY